MSDPVRRDLRIELTLTEEDLAWFETRLKDARDKQSGQSGEEIIAAVKATKAKADASNPPQFVTERLAHLEELVAMVEDKGWAMPEAHRALVLDSLAYFSDPDDIIPDDVKVFGYVDDALMIDLVCSGLQPEISAYRDFVEAREAQAEAADPELLEAERKALQARMSRRRRRRRVRGSAPIGEGFSPFQI